MCVQFDVLCTIQAVSSMPYEGTMPSVPSQPFSRKENNFADNSEYIRKLEYRQARLKQQYNQLLQEQKRQQQAARVGAISGRKYSDISLQLAKQMSQLQKEIYAIDKELAELKGVDEYGESAHKKSSSPVKSIECSKCHGSGQCTQCAGRGEKRYTYMGQTTMRDCSWCKGTGRCRVCNGKGKKSYNVGYH